MTAISKVLRATNWKHAIGEVLLIVVGISIALAADSWWEERQERDDERLLLAQCLEALRSDLEDIDARLSTVRERNESMQALQAHIKSGLPYSADLAPRFRLMGFWQRSYFSTAPYETLKSRGLDKISNSELRLQIVDYYDRQISRVERRDSTDQSEVQQYITPYLRSRFEFGGKPLDYGSLIQDSEFLYILDLKATILQNLTLPTYERIVTMTRDLIAALEEELD